MKLISGLLMSVLFAQTSFASSIAVIDSGVDVNHTELSDQIWVNPGEVAGNGKDDEGNGHIDDINGWNFAENNNELIMMKYKGTFSSDVRTYLEYQTRALEGTATDEMLIWMRSKKGEEKFIKEMNIFGNWAHGTHVSGISALGNQNGIMGIKLLPTEPPGVPGKSLQSYVNFLNETQPESMNPIKDALLKMALKFVASNNSKLFIKTAEYAHKNKADVANCSFGISYANARNIVEQLLRQFNKDAEPTEEQIASNARFLVEEVVKGGVTMAATAPNTLFVMAAGNDAANNDVDPAAPANSKADNVITVAATMGVTKFAEQFSNYGLKMVEVAAPGVGILSTMPGNEHILMSGTSMAAPFVANAASQVKTANPALTPLQVKKVLMGTVDKKTWLANKVTTGGIVNKERATVAAELSKSMSIDAAVAQARVSINDVQEESSLFATGFEANFDESLIWVAPMPGLPAL